VADPPPQPTAFGAGTVAGAVAAAAMAGRDIADEPAVRDEETVAPGDGTLESGPPTEQAHGTADRG
jgi:hypothetical protein